MSEKDKKVTEVEKEEKTAVKDNGAVEKNVEDFITRKLKSINQMPDSHIRDYLAARILDNRREKR